MAFLKIDRRHWTILKSTGTFKKNSDRGHFHFLKSTGDIGGPHQGPHRGGLWPAPSWPVAAWWMSRPEALTVSAHAALTLLCRHKMRFDKATIGRKKSVARRPSPRGGAGELIPQTRQKLARRHHHQTPDLLTSYPNFFSSIAPSLFLLSIWVEYNRYTPSFLLQCFFLDCVFFSQHWQLTPNNFYSVAEICLKPTSFY